MNGNVLRAYWGDIMETKQPDKGFESDMFGIIWLDYTIENVMEELEFILKYSTKKLPWPAQPKINDCLSILRKARTRITEHRGWRP